MLERVLLVNIWVFLSLLNIKLFLVFEWRPLCAVNALKVLVLWDCLKFSKSLDLSLCQ